MLNGLVTKDFDQVGHQISSKPVEFDGDLRRRKIAYNDVMKNYDELWLRTESLDRAKRKVLRSASSPPGAYLCLVLFENSVDDRSCGWRVNLDLCVFSFFIAFGV